MRTFILMALLGGAVMALDISPARLPVAHAAHANQQIKTYRWTGRAVILKKSGLRLPVDGSGTLQAQSIAFATAYADNAFKGGYVEPLRELGETLAECSVNVVEVR